MSYNFNVLFFRDYSPSLALAILTNNTIKLSNESLQRHILDTYFTSYDIGRLEKYGNNMSDYHLIMDLISPLARLYFMNLMGSTHFSPVQSAILLSLGLQHKTVDQVVEELNKSTTNDANVLVSSQVLGLFNRIICKATKYLNEIIKDNVGIAFKGIDESTDHIKVSHEKGELRKELEAADKELKRKQQIELEKLKQASLDQYAIKGSETEWSNALKSGKGNKNLLSVKSIEKRAQANDQNNLSLQEKGKGNKKKGNKRKHSF